MSLPGPPAMVSLMGRGQHTFKESEITRLIRAAKKAGIDPIIDIDIARKRIIIRDNKNDCPAASSTNGSVHNEWDIVLNDKGSE